MVTYFKGFSTVGRDFGANTLTDQELIKQDLFNHFRIRKGEKLMNPEFGTIIWHMLFEPLTEATSNLIIDDVKEIIGADPRVNLTNVTLIEYEHGIRIEADVQYASFDTVEKLTLGFDNNVGLVTN